MRVDPDGPYGLHVQKEYQKISQTHRQSLNKLSGKIRRGDVVIYTGTLSPDLHGEIGIVTAVESDECVDVLISSNILYPLGLIGKNLEVIDHDEDLLKEPEYHSQQMRDEMDEQGTVMSFNDGIDHDEDEEKVTVEVHPWDKDLREHYHQHGQDSCARPREIHPEAPMNMMGVYEIQGRRVQVDLHPGVAGETPSIKFTCCCCGSKLLDLPIEFPYPPIANRKWISDTHKMGE